MRSAEEIVDALMDHVVYFSPRTKEHVFRIGTHELGRINSDLPDDVFYRSARTLLVQWINGQPTKPANEAPEPKSGGTDK